MTSKEYLRQAHNLNARINAHIREKEELQHMVYTISSPQLGERVQTSRNTDAPYARTIEKITLLEERITKEIDQLVDLKAEIYDAINCMENSDEQLLLQYRYCEDCSWEDIGIAMHMSVRTVHRVHSSALRNFVVPEKN